MASVLSFDGSLSFSFGFRRALSNCETTDVLTLLSYIEEVEFRHGRRNFRGWSLSSSEGFSCNSFSLWMNIFIRCEFFSYVEC